MAKPESRRAVVDGGGRKPPTDAASTTAPQTQPISSALATVARITVGTPTASATQRDGGKGRGAGTGTSASPSRRRSATTRTMQASTPRSDASEGDVQGRLGGPRDRDRGRLVRRFDATTRWRCRRRASAGRASPLVGLPTNRCCIPRRARPSSRRAGRHLDGPTVRDVAVTVGGGAAVTPGRRGRRPAVRARPDRRRTRRRAGVEASRARAGPAPRSNRRRSTVASIGRSVQDLLGGAR